MQVSKHLLSIYFVAQTMPGPGEAETNITRLSRHLQASRKEALKQLHKHIALSPSSVGREETRITFDSERNQKVKSGSELTLPPLPPWILNPQTGNILLYSLISELQNVSAGTIHRKDWSSERESDLLSTIKLVSGRTKLSRLAPDFCWEIFLE